MDKNDCIMFTKEEAQSSPNQFKERFFLAIEKFGVKLSDVEDILGFSNPIYEMDLCYLMIKHKDDKKVIDQLFEIMFDGLGLLFIRAEKEKMVLDFNLSFYETDSFKKLRKMVKTECAKDSKRYKKHHKTEIEIDTRELEM